MGELITAVCECGFTKQVHSGSGMQMHYSGKRIDQHYCKKCGLVDVIVDGWDSITLDRICGEFEPTPSACPNCQSTTIPYGKHPLTVLIEGDALPSKVSEKVGKTRKKTLNYCPSCHKMLMEFRWSGMWD